MPLGGQSGHVVFHYGTVASPALGSEHIEVVVSAVRAAFPLVESLLAELFAALSAEKVFGVPSLLQSRHAFLEKQHRTIIIAVSAAEAFLKGFPKVERKTALVERERKRECTREQTPFSTTSPQTSFGSPEWYRIHDLGS